jgi:hypothetical protein
VLAIIAFGFSGTAALIHWGRILPGMAKAGVPESWLTTLGVLKVSGAAGLLLGLLGVPYIGAAAALGLVLFFIGAIVVHVRARDFTGQFGLASFLLTLGVVTFAIELAAA